MGRYRLNYSLYPRRVSPTKIVYYYRTYDSEGKRTSGKSTFESVKSRAKLYCEKLLKEGKLIPSPETLFETYAADFYTPDGRWVRSVKFGSTVSLNTLQIRQSAMKNYILPFFGNCKINTITFRKVKEFQIHLIDKGLSENTINSICVTLRVIINEAIKDKLLNENPFEHISQIQVTSTARDSFTLEELKKIINSSWKNNYVRNAFIFASLTGMRLGEVLAINDEAIKENYIDVKYQMGRDGELVPTKTKTCRKVPICSKVRDWLLNNKGPDFAFPSHHTLVRYHVSNELKKCKIENIAERKLSFHSTRHFFNTYMLSENPDCQIKIAAIMGHSTGVSSVQNTYINFKAENYTEIIESQEKLWDCLFK